MCVRAWCFPLFLIINVDDKWEKSPDFMFWKTFFVNNWAKIEENYCTCFCSSLVLKTYSWWTMCWWRARLPFLNEGFSHLSCFCWGWWGMKEQESNCQSFVTSHCQTQPIIYPQFHQTPSVPNQVWFFSPHWKLTHLKEAKSQSIRTYLYLYILFWTKRQAKYLNNVTNVKLKECFWIIACVNSKIK